jgi:hypothetical protein
MWLRGATPRSRPFSSNAPAMSLRDFVRNMVRAGDENRRRFTTLQELIKRSKGRYFRGNLHCHSDLSDGKRTPADVVAAYHDAGYDFIVLSDHFEGEYGWRVTDTRAMRAEGLTTILAAELSSGPWNERKHESPSPFRDFRDEKCPNDNRNLAMGPLLHGGRGGLSSPEKVIRKSMSPVARRGPT